MKTPYEKYRSAESRRWEKFKVEVRDTCKHPEEYVTSKYRSDEDEYGCTNYNYGTTTYNCKFCGEIWFVETKRT